MNFRLPILSAVTVLIILFLSSCKDDPASNNNQEIDNEHFVVNHWIRNNMEIYYFWNEHVPEKADGSIKPEVFFESMLDSEDKFSNISDDAESYLDDVQGSSFSAGYSPQFTLYTENGNDIFIFVRYVYPGSPAEEAGLKRGDLIFKINGQTLNRSNYLDLYYSNSATDKFTVGYYKGDGEVYSRDDFVESHTISVTKVEKEWNPIINTSVFENNGTKTGYMFYARFVSGKDSSLVYALEDTLANLKARGITELIVDLRYNPGGTISTTKSFANAIAPVSVTQNEEIFVKYQYNDFLQNYYQDATKEDPDAITNLEIRFSEAPVNLGLDQVFFITTDNSASASELLINGLEPYMDVISIGTPTFGKYYGAAVLTGMNAKPSHNYAISPVTMKYANANGVTDFAEGLQPDYPMSREYIFDVEEIGSSTDPYIAKALEIITGQDAPLAKRPARSLNLQVDNHVELQKGNVMFIPEK